MRQGETDQGALVEADERDEFSDEEDAIAKYIADGEKENWLRWAILALGAIFLVSVAAGSIVWWTTNNKEMAGQFGDTFGFVNAVVSGMAFALFFITLLMQRHELGFQRKELRLNLIEMKRSRREYAKMAKAQQESEKRQLLSSFVSSAETMRQMYERRKSMLVQANLKDIEEAMFLKLVLSQLTIIHGKIGSEAAAQNAITFDDDDGSLQIANRLIPLIKRLNAVIRLGDGDDGATHGLALRESIAACAGGIRNIMHLIIRAIGAKPIGR